MIRPPPPPPSPALLLQQQQQQQQLVMMTMTVMMITETDRPTSRSAVSGVTSVGTRNLLLAISDVDAM